MTDCCLDTDSLVSVASALEWAVPARLDHLASCERCRARLAELADLQRGLVAATPLAALDRATASARTGAPSAAIPSRPASKGAPAPAPAASTWSRSAPPLVTTATFLIAGATALLLVTMLGGNPPAPLALTVAGVAGLASIAPIRLRRQDA